MKPPQIVEAVLFASDAPLRAEEIARADTSLDEDVVEEAIRELQREYDDGERAFEIREVGGGFQIMTRPEFAPYLERFDTVPRPSRLSGPALETLAIIAYRQPIGRIEMEYIRGVGSAGVIRTLQDRGLVEVVGRAEGLGRPLLYGTGARFLEHFGFRSLEDLPRPEDLPVLLRDRVSLGLDDDEPPDAELVEAADTAPSEVPAPEPPDSAAADTVAGDVTQPEAAETAPPGPGDTNHADAEPAETGGADLDDAAVELSDALPPEAEIVLGAAGELTEEELTRGRRTNGHAAPDGNGGRVSSENDDGAEKRHSDVRDPWFDDEADTEPESPHG